MRRILPGLLLAILIAFPAVASVEIGRGGRPPVTIEDVYLHEGIPYVAIDEILGPLGVRGGWNSVEHVYSFTTPQGKAVFFPGGRYLRIAERFHPIKHPARFIDGRLRVSEDFITVLLPSLLGEPVYYRNLNPPEAYAEEEGTLDRLFSFLLRKKKTAGGPALRGIAIDPGHGGQNTGAIGMQGSKEKDVALGVAVRLEKIIKMQLGIPVYLSRNGDYELTPQQRIEPATRPEVDAFLLLHAQASFSGGHRGVTLLIRPVGSFEGEPAGSGEESRRLAQSLQRALEKEGFLVNAILEAPLLPLGRGDLPTVLVELGYLSNPSDWNLMAGSEGQERLARALFAGLQRFAEKGKEGP